LGVGGSRRLLLRCVCCSRVVWWMFLGVLDVLVWSGFVCALWRGVWWVWCDVCLVCAGVV